MDNNWIVKILNEAGLKLGDSEYNAQYNLLYASAPPFMICKGVSEKVRSALNKEIQRVREELRQKG